MFVAIIILKKNDLVAYKQNNGLPIGTVKDTCVAECLTSIHTAVIMLFCCFFSSHCRTQQAHPCVRAGPIIVHTHSDVKRKKKNTVGIRELAFREK